MAFAINSHNLPSCSDYAGALRAFEKSPGWGRHSGRNSGERRMTGRPDRDHMAVRINDVTEDVIFRYHSTDVFTWHKDGTFTIKPWGSMSTSAFIGAFAPSGVYAQMTHGAGPVMCCYKQNYDEKIYITMNTTRFKYDDALGVWTVDERCDGTEPIDYPRIKDRRSARLALEKYDFHGFVATLAPMMDILGVKTMRAKLKEDEFNRLEEVAFSLNGTRYGHRNIVEAIKDRSLWPAFLMARYLKPEHRPHKTYYGRSMEYTRKRHINLIAKHVRAAIYKHEGVIENRPMAYATSWDQLKAAKAASNLYGFD